MTLSRIFLLGIGILLVAQLIPYGRVHSNPPVTLEPAWDSAATRELFFRACRDCHSNETVWPWYSHVAPVSWLVTSDVEEGREHFNVSVWDRPKQDGDEAAEMVRGFRRIGFSFRGVAGRFARNFLFAKIKGS